MEAVSLDVEAVSDDERRMARLSGAKRLRASLSEAQARLEALAADTALLSSRLATEAANADERAIEARAAARERATAYRAEEADARARLAACRREREELEAAVASFAEALRKEVATMEATALLCQLSDCRDEDEEALSEIQQLEETVNSARRRIDVAQAALQERSASWKPSMTPSTVETKPKQRSVAESGETQASIARALSLPEPA